MKPSSTADGAPRKVQRKRVGPPLRFPLPRWQGTEVADPFGQVFRFHADRGTLLRASLLAFVIYGGAVAAAVFSPRAQRVGPPPKQEIPVVTMAPPPPPPPAEQPIDEPPPPPRPTRVRRAAAPAPPAQASQVLTRQDSSAPADFGDFAIATGHGDVYAGGYTASNGTSRGAVTAPPGPPQRTAGRSAAPSQARGAAPIRRDWTCAWPEAAIDSDLRETRVAVRVAISVDGEATDATIEGQALPGFAEAARRCALAESYRPALNERGERVASQTGLLVVHFLR